MSNRVWSSGFAPILLTAVSIWFPKGVYAGDAPIRPLVVTGDPAAGWAAGPGHTFSDFGPAAGVDSMVMSDQGRAWFIGKVGSEYGVWTATSRSDIQIVAQAGAPAPGISDHNFSYFTDLRNAGAGKVAIQSYIRVANTLTDDALGFWVGTTEDDLQSLLVPHQPAAGYPQGWSYTDGAQLAFSPSGSAVITTLVQGPFHVTPQPHYETDFAIYSGTREDNLQPIFQLGSLPPSDSFSLLGLTSSGRMVGTAGYSIEIGQPGDMRQVRFNGQIAYLRYPDNSLSVAGERYVATLMPYGQQVITGTNPDDAVLLANGDALPGAPAGKVLGISTVHVDPSGRITFAAGITGPAFVSGLWQGTSSADLHPIIITGQPAVGTNDTLFLIHSTGFNDLGEVAFIGDLTLNGVADGAGMFAYDPSTGLRLVARTGDTVEIGPGDVRTIASFVHPYLGDAPVLSDTGTMLFRVGFTDGSSGLMLADLPEPAALCLVIAAGLCLARRRHQRRE